MALRFVLLCLLVVTAALNVGLALSIIPRSDEVRYGEATIYAHAARLLHGEALYQPLGQPSFSVATYTVLLGFVNGFVSR